MIAIVSVSVFSEANERAHHVNLQKVLQELTADFIESGGTEMQGWIEQNDDRAISQRFKNEKTALIQTLEEKGFQVKASDLKIRKDEKKGIILGAIYTTAQQDDRLVWGSTDSEREKSRAGNSEPSQVLMDQWDSLIFMGLMSIMFIAFIWLAPVLLKRKKTTAQIQQWRDV